MPLADWLQDVEDGFYGDVDAFLTHYKTGQEQALYDQLEAKNAVSSEHKIRLWIHSREYNSWVDGGHQGPPPSGGYIVGCG